MNFALQEVAGALGLATEYDAAITGWSIDSRTVEPGDLFFALRGPTQLALPGPRFDCDPAFERQR